MNDLSDLGGQPNQYDNTVQQIESGGDPNAVNPNSGAAGAYQFIPSTAQQYGLQDPTDIVQSTGAFHQLTNDNKNALKGAIGRDPTDGELYLAHQQGAHGAAALLNNPDEPAVNIVGKNAVLFNGGNLNMTSQQFADHQINLYNQKLGLPQQTTQQPDPNDLSDLGGAQIQGDPNDLSDLGGTPAPDEGILRSAIGSWGNNSLLSAPLDAVSAEAKNLVNGSGFMNNWNQVRQQSQDEYNQTSQQHPYATQAGNIGAAVTDLTVGQGIGKLAGAAVKPLLEAPLPNAAGFAEGATQPTAFGTVINNAAKPSNLLPNFVSRYLPGGTGQSSIGISDIATGAGLVQGGPAGALTAYGLTKVAPTIAANIIKNPEITGGVVGIGGAIQNMIAANGNVISVKSLANPLVQQALGPYNQPLQQAATRGQDAITSTDFILQQTDPGYRQRLIDISQKYDELQDQMENQQLSYQMNQD